MHRPTAHPDSRSSRLNRLSWGCRGRRQATRWARGPSDEPMSVADVVSSSTYSGIQKLARGIASNRPLQTLVDSAYLDFLEDWMQYTRLVGTPKLFGEDFAREVRAICTVFSRVYIDVWAVNGCTRLVNECMKNPSNHPAFRAHLAAVCTEAWRNMNYMIKHRHVRVILSDKYTDSSPPDNDAEDQSAEDGSSLEQLDPQGPIVIITPPAPYNHVYERYWRKAGYSRPLSNTGKTELEPGRLRVPWCSVKYGEIETVWDSSLPNWHFNRFPPGVDCRSTRSARSHKMKTASRRRVAETDSPCSSSKAVHGDATTKNGRKRAKNAEAKQPISEQERETLEKREKAKEIARVAAKCQAAFNAMLSRVEPSPTEPNRRTGGKKVSTAPPKLFGRRKPAPDAPAQVWGLIANWPLGDEDGGAGRTDVGASHKPRKPT